jgi:acetylornithine deacetylase/succinyl-diaminopimelate desuccinylase-like protein
MRFLVWQKPGWKPCASRLERFEVVSSLLNKVLDLAVEIQQIPAPTFKEGSRAAFLRERFLAEGLQDVALDEIGNVYARLPGLESSPPVIVSAHTDTVFPESTSLKVVRTAERITAAGIGDNSLGVAGLLGLLWNLREQNISLPGDLWLVGNVGEEGLGDLRGMRAVVDRFGNQPLAYIVLEGMALGQIYHRGLGVRRYLIQVQTPGGHSWVNYGAPSAVHELARLATRLLDLSLPSEPRSSLNIGLIAGGLSVNTIAAQAQLELDLRSEDYYTLLGIVQKVEILVRKANRPSVNVSLKIIGDRPVGKIPADHPLVNLAYRILLEQGIEPCLNIGSTDANIPLSMGLPAICLGLTMGNSAHTNREYIQTRPLSKGLRQIVAVVKGAYRELRPLKG